jgi:V8-like Glu-specific endopeptidase
MIRSVASAAIVLMATLAPAHAQQSACTSPPRETRSTQFGVQKSASINIVAGGGERGYNGNDAGLGVHLKASYYRLRIIPVAGADAANWSLTIRDQDQRVQQILGPADFAGVGQHGVWTRFLKARSVVFDLHAPPDVAVSLTLVEVIVLPEGSGEIRYSWKGPTADYKELYSYTGADKDSVRRSGDRVAFLVGWDVTEVAGTSRSVNWCCSGVLLTKDLMLTNWHCGGQTSARPNEMWRDSAIDGRTCDQVLINLAWDDGSASRDAGCDKVELISKELDYAIVRLKPVAGGTPFLTTTRPVRIATSRPALGTQLRIVHHAECKPKFVSFSCAVSEAERSAWDGSGRQTEFAHNCDTEGGSSGAPIFTLGGQLVGLHHMGYEPIPGDPGNRCDQKNKAIHIDAILADIKDRRSSLHQEIMSALAR